MVEQTAMGQLMFELHSQITGQTDFGLDLGSVMSGAAPMPALGLRVDVSFEGTVVGTGLQGTIQGIDYVHMQGDGSGRIHAHSVITTQDGHRIAVDNAGIGLPQQGTPIVKLNETITLWTASAKYAWVNTTRLWAVGESNLQTGEITLKAYAASQEMAASG